MNTEEIRAQIRKDVPFENVTPKTQEETVEMILQNIIKSVSKEVAEKFPEDKREEFEARLDDSGFNSANDYFDYLGQYIPNLDTIIKAWTLMEINEFKDISSGARLLRNIESGKYSKKHE